MTSYVVQVWPNIQTDAGRTLGSGSQAASDDSSSPDGSLEADSFRDSHPPEQGPGNHLQYIKPELGNGDSSESVHEDGTGHYQANSDEQESNSCVHEESIETQISLDDHRGSEKLDHG